MDPMVSRVGLIMDLMVSMAGLTMDPTVVKSAYKFMGGGGSFQIIKLTTKIYNPM